MAAFLHNLWITQETINQTMHYAVVITQVIFEMKRHDQGAAMWQPNL